MALSYSFRRPVPGLYGDFDPNDPNGPNDSESEFRTPGMGVPTYAFDQPMEPAPSPAPPPASRPGPIESRGTYSGEAEPDIQLPHRPDLSADPSIPSFGEGQRAQRELYGALESGPPALEKRGGFSRFLGGLTGMMGPFKGTDIPQRLTYTGESIDANRAYAQKLKGLEALSGLEKDQGALLRDEEKLLYDRKAEQDKIKRDQDIGKSVDQNRLISAGYQPYDPATVQPSEMAGTPVLALDGKQYYLPVKMEIVGTPSTGISGVNTRTREVTQITQPPAPKPAAPIIRNAGRDVISVDPVTNQATRIYRGPESPGTDTSRSDAIFQAKTMADLDAEEAKLERTYNDRFDFLKDELEKRSVEDPDAAQRWYSSEIRALQGRWLADQEALKSQRSQYERIFTPGGRIALPQTGTGTLNTAPPDTRPVQPGPPQTQPPQLPTEQQAPGAPKSYTIEEVNAAAAKIGKDPAELIRRIQAEGGTVIGGPAPLRKTEQPGPEPVVQLPPAPPPAPEPPLGIRLGPRGREWAESLGDYFGSFKSDRQRAAEMRNRRNL